jgi:hypothetical protein
VTGTVKGTVDPRGGSHKGFASPGVNNPLLANSTTMSRSRIMYSAASKEKSYKHAAVVARMYIELRERCVDHAAVTAGVVSSDGVGAGTPRNSRFARRMSSAVMLERSAIERKMLSRRANRFSGVSNSAMRPASSTQIRSAEQSMRSVAARTRERCWARLP